MIYHYLKKKCRKVRYTFEPFVSTFSYSKYEMCQDAFPEQKELTARNQMLIHAE